MTEIAERAATTAMESDRSYLVRGLAGAVAWAAVPFVLNEQAAAGISGLAPHSAYKALTAAAHQRQRALMLEAEGQSATDAWLAMAQEGALGVAEVASTVSSLSKLKGLVPALRRAPRFIPRPTLTHRGIVWGRQGSACAGCGVEMTRHRGPHQMHLDHPEPYSKHGPIHPLQAVGLCATCNLEKADMELIEWLGMLDDALTWEDAVAEAAAVEEAMAVEEMMAEEAVRKRRR